MSRNVVVSNSLNRSVQKLTIHEKRLMMLAVSKLDKECSINHMITITASEYSTIYNVGCSNIYRTLKASRAKLWNREFTMNGVTFRWLITCSYNEGEGSISIRFHPDLDGLIVGLKSRFTKYLLKRASDFKNIYTWRLFELLMQYRSTGILKITLDEFKEVMIVPVAYDRDFGLVRRKVIDLAISEIKDKDGLNVKYKTIKTGRSITDLVFSFPVEVQKKIRLVTDDEINKEARPGESYLDVKNRLMNS